MKSKVVIFWFRRDLRLEDNVGLHHALTSGFPVLPVFIFDPDILDRLENKNDRRVDYIHQALSAVDFELKNNGGRMNAYFNKVMDVFNMLLDKYDIQAVYCNRDYEPQAIERDSKAYYFFKSINIPFRAYKDQVIFDKNDIIKKDNSPYTVFTPYAKKWREKLQFQDYQTMELHLPDFFKQEHSTIPLLAEIGFNKTDIVFELPKLDANIIDDYEKYRDFPAMQRTTQLGVALRFGTISIRKCVAFALQHNQTWLSELIWREFFFQILYHFPKVVGSSFKEKYDFIQWRNDEEAFNQWCEGKTGYPLVDAGMRQLNQTGYMHNRVRMLVASFLCKNLLIDWRWGEAYFAQKLTDFDLSANNGNWQWAAGCGSDAAPYFRVFNPSTQIERFDKDLVYIRKWVPEFDTNEYPKPIVEFTFSRERALGVYGKAVKGMATSSPKSSISE